MSQSDPQSPARTADNRVQELRASAHLMTLDSGVFCLVHGSPKPADRQLTGVRVSAVDPADSTISIVTFRPDGWLSGGGDSALIRVLSDSAQILITIYQPVGSTEAAPRLRVLRLSEAAAEGAADTAAESARRPRMLLTEPHDIIAHIQRRGDVGEGFGNWVGTPGSQMAVEGFSLTAPDDLVAGDITYQAILGRGWLSPWNEAGQFCGSRGMALPILGFKLKLSEAAEKRYTLSVSATFLDGSTLDDLGSEDSIEAPSLSPLEAFRITLTAKAGVRKAPAAAKPAAQPAPALAAKGRAAVPATSAAKPAAKPVIKTPLKPIKRSR